MLDAAKAMKLSAKDLLDLQVIDEIVKEPLGGAHRDKSLILETIRLSIKQNLEYFKEMSPEQIYDERKNKFLKIGRNKGFIDNLENLSSLKPQKNNFDRIFKSKRNLIYMIVAISILVASSLIFL